VGSTKERKRVQPGLLKEAGKNEGGIIVSQGLSCVANKYLNVGNHCCPNSGSDYGRLDRACMGVWESSVPFS